MSRRYLLYWTTVFLGLGVFAYWVRVRSDALEEARRHLERGDTLNALRRGLDHLERRPGDREASKIAALCLSRLDRAELAEERYRAAGGPERLSVEEAHVRALGLTRANRRSEAVAAYREILDRRPDDPTATQRLATILLTMNRFPEALALAKRLADMPGKAVVGYALMGTVSHQDDVPEDAAAAYERVLALDPDLKELPFPPRLFWTELISDMLASGRAAEGARHLARALASDSGDPLYLDMKGEVSFQQGDMAAATSAWEEAKRRDPMLSRPWRGLGVIALGRGDLDAAVRNLTRAAELAPADAAALYQLSQAHRRRGETAKADELRRRSEEIRRGEKPSKRGMGAPPAGGGA